jgi:hypothetical protein
MSQPHDNQVVRWNDYSPLTASAVHVISIFENRESPVAIDPEKSAISVLTNLTYSSGRLRLAASLAGSISLPLL